ncbi:transcriptional regulator [Candidatus Shapirobacteria bacterium CG06_land_8_20_14_3_00_40_12]|uniref:Transcriptional regulator n=1 Tax=Candidatus Shapirobacteria bacterium CG06_land_8_20_14_3_00_40_12 TaxID=1974881 RepID=A0A2M7ARY5_9BACT|nr:MAG: transcriptional regulator [Candidatus Shapirobacteria bacterium CG06_land_8_20_14_3_00_40_12]
MDWITHKKQLLKKSAFRKALKESELEFQIAKSVIEARLKKGLTQKQLAKKLDTRQSVISRLENIKTTPSLSFLKRLAVATGSKLTVTFQ